jgi:hypothetical protein
MNDTIRFILSLSILPAAVIGAVKFRKMDPSYRLFIYYIFFVLGFEVFVYSLMRLAEQQAAFSTLGVSYNIYAIAEFSFLRWVFHKWGLFNNNQKVFLSIIVVFLLSWFLSTLLIKGFYKRNHYFAIAYSFALIFFSISAFNKLVVQERKSMLRNPKFWICLGIVIFFSYFAISSSVKILIFRNDDNKEFFDKLQDINVYANLLANLLYAAAILWIPNKKNFITR